MRKSWLLCVLLGTLAWGQAAPAAPPPQPGQAPAAMGAKPQAPEDTAAAVPDDAAVITVNGVCPSQSDNGSPAQPSADCKTVITKAQFEKLANSLAPNATPQQKKQLAGLLPRLIAMSSEAKKEGLDQTASFDETLKFVKMQVLSNQLQRKIQEEAGNIPPEDIQKYYDEHKENFEQFNVDRLFVPRTKQNLNEGKEDNDKDEKLTDAQKKAKEAADKAKAEAAEAAMTKLADKLRARAAAGENIAALQKEAFEAAGMKIESPTVNLPNVRRTGLPPGHAAVFDLKAGEVSQVISDSGGHYIYKINSKTEMTLDQATNEITGKMKNDRVRERMDQLSNSFKADTNEAYFGPGGAGSMPPPRGPRPRPGMPPTGPAPQPQAAPPAQQPN